MQKELPSFEGREVQAGVARFSGKVVEMVGSMHDGETAVVIARVKVNKIQHAEFQAKSGANSAKLYSRIHDCAVISAVVIPEEQGLSYFDQAKQARRDEYGIQDLWSTVEDDEDELRADIEPMPHREITEGTGPCEVCGGVNGAHNNYRHAEAEEGGGG